MHKLQLRFQTLYGIVYGLAVKRITTYIITVHIVNLFCIYIYLARCPSSISTTKIFLKSQKKLLKITENKIFDRIIEIVL